MIKYDRNAVNSTKILPLIAPENKQANDKILREEIHRAKKDGRPAKFNSRIYGNREIKRQLSMLSHGKCYYCDQYIESSAYGDVDHYRPKSKYWWLAYTWENLVFSCQLCNQMYKKGHFPVAGRRANGPRSNLDDERPLLINPLDENPEDHIAYDSDGDEVSIISCGDSSGRRVEVCLKYYGLNRESLLNSRRVMISYLKVYRALLEDSPPAQKDIIIREVKDMAAENSEFAGMIRYYANKWAIHY